AGPAAAVPELLFGLVDQTPELLHALEHGREADRVGPARVGEEMGEGRLAAAGRAPEDERLDLAALDHVPQDPSGAEEMRLADELVDGARPHPLRERSTSRRCCPRTRPGQP